MRNAVLIAICACALALAADPPYAGQWKINPAKSQFGDQSTWSMSAAWKVRNFNSSSPQAITLTPKGGGALVFSMGNEIGVCEAKLDGKPYPASGPRWEPGWTCAIIETAGHGLQLTWRKDGKVIYSSTVTVTVSDDLLTEISTSANGQKIKIVYDRDRLLMDPPMQRSLFPPQFFELRK
jgi:hypothetical protein